jgi:hypothetical protein
MTEQEIKDNAPSGATGYHVAKHDGHITYYKTIGDFLYFFDGNNWEWSGFNEDVPPSQFHSYINPL